MSLKEVNQANISFATINKIFSYLTVKGCYGWPTPLFIFDCVLSDENKIISCYSENTHLLSIQASWTVNYLVLSHLGFGNIFFVFKGPTWDIFQPFSANL